MKYIIDLLDNVREEIGNQEDFILTAMLLKENPEDSDKLIYMGEAPLNVFHLDEVGKELIFKIDSGEARITVGELIPLLVILDMPAMMYVLKMDVNVQYRNMEVVGFGKSIDEKKYILFIKI